jgi:hypothetical protein
MHQGFRLVHLWSTFDIREIFVMGVTLQHHKELEHRCKIVSMPSINNVFDFVKTKNCHRAEILRNFDKNMSIVESVIATFYIMAPRQISRDLIKPRPFLKFVYMHNNFICSFHFESFKLHVSFHMNI